MSRKALLLWVLAALAPLRPSAAVRNCGTPEATAEQLQRVAADLQAYQARVSAAAATCTGALTIDVTVIVAGSQATQAMVTPSVIQTQINLLNRAFAPTYSFVLRNPSLTRSVNPAYDNLALSYELDSPEGQLKSAFRQGAAKDLYLYFATLADDLLGWATFPMEYADRPWRDGVIVGATTLPGGSQAPYNEGATAVHEVGHWLGLFHTFQGGCTGEGDQVADTPAEADPAYGCPTGRDSCPDLPGSDPVSNYMNYGDDFCLTEFTTGQRDRMTGLNIIYRDFTCASGCPATCPPGTECDPASESCRSPPGAACDSSTDCFSEAECDETGTCTLPAMASCASAAGETPLPCPSGTTCDFWEEQCQYQVGRTCSITEECAGKAICDPVSKECRVRRRGLCRASSACATGLRCVLFSCKRSFFDILPFDLRQRPL